MAEKKEQNEKEEQLGLLGSYEVPESLSSLTGGYLDYASEVIMSRAIPMIDGFKPSQRRILYVMRELERVTRMRKSADVAGSVTKLHPHSDAGIYDTMVRMVGASEHLNIPFLEGKGSFGKVYFGNEISPSAPRYTEVKLEEITEELFKGMRGIEMLPSYNSEIEEPFTLPVSFPSILCNASEGIAVGIASKIPPFNFHEVIEGTIKYIETGEYPEEMYPDFPTGGYVVRDEKEMEKIMRTGRGRLSIRGKYHIDKRKIIITEIPYYTTIKRIEDEANKIEDVLDVRNGTDRRKGLWLSIECRTQKQTGEILEEIIRTTPFQGSLNTNMVIIGEGDGGKSIIKPDMGVNAIIKEWVEYRKGVLVREYEYQLKEVEFEIHFLNILVDLMTTEEKREKFLDLLLYEGRAGSREYLESIYEGIGIVELERILNRSLGSLGKVGEKQREELKRYKRRKEELEEGINEVESRIVEELKRVNSSYSYPRRTEITEKSYTFEDYVEPEEEVVEVGLEVNNKFIKKLRGTPHNLSQPGVRVCKSDDILTILDNRGRLLRVQLKDIEYSNLRDKGVYLPLYLGEEDDSYSVLDYEVSRAYVEGYLYNDGYISVIDYNEWVDKQRVIQIIELGLAPTHIGKMLGKVHLDRGYVVVRTSKGRIGVYKLDFKAKSRRGRTKLISLGKGEELVDYVSVSKEEAEGIVGEKGRYVERLRVVREEDSFDEDGFSSYKARTKWGSKREDEKE